MQLVAIDAIRHLILKSIMVKYYKFSDPGLVSDYKKTYEELKNSGDIRSPVLIWWSRPKGYGWNTPVIIDWFTIDYDNGVLKSFEYHDQEITKDYLDKNINIQHRFGWIFEPENSRWEK